MAQRVSVWAVWLVAGVLSGCAAQGTLPPQPHVDVAAEQAAADRAYAAGDMAQAESLYDALTRAVPDDADVWYRLGNARFRLQHPDDAVVAYARAVQLKPDHAQALYNLGVVRLKQAQAAMIGAAQAAAPGDALRRDGARVAQRLSRVADDMGTRGNGDGGAPPFIIEPDAPSH
jgi:cytochrome c-type biogenesis protein CcmH/NrfG